MWKPLVLGFFSSVAVVEPVLAEVWFDVAPGEVQHIRAEGRAGLVGYYLQFTRVFPGDDGCSARDFAYIRADNQLAKEMYSTALAALAMGAKIRVATTGCDGIGNVIQAVGISFPLA